MTPKHYFDEVWRRADMLSTIHAYLSQSVTHAIETEEILRAEWMTRVSALDLYVHELVAQELLRIFQGLRVASAGYSKIHISSGTLMRIHSAGAGRISDIAFDLEVRSRLARITYQFPDDIADGVRLISDVQLWNALASYYGAKPATVGKEAALLKGQLSQVVNRRNKIAHEGDFQPGLPRTPWSINRADTEQVKETIERIVMGIEAVIA